MTAAAPTLMPGASLPPRAADFYGSRPAKSLLDLLYDGFLMLFLLKSGQEPVDAASFSARVQQFLADFERSAKKMDIPAEDVYATKYAFCAAVDETVLNSGFSIRDAWMLQPLQLTLFGEQLAGENFFARLEDLRAQGAPRLQSLEVFYMCLLLGFQGKYMIEGQEKLGYLTARLGDEITLLRGKRAGFAPHWPLPDKIAHTLKRDVPLWSIGALFALLGLLAYLGMSHFLNRDMQTAMAPYHDIVKIGPRAAHLTISLP
ncbi:DotU family type IV/VI secretion system protein [Achromobacter sp. K91]|jgi:type VI secretion system protein ImpK|uniref:DotU family type IV/VI secretion system protein n=3 Tax=Achromobacter TaxID=222 RepID=A0A2T5CJQ2_ALCXX|nr:DotU family type IV/VI secretion system protein [Achromobacter xylosoxidans]MBD9382557.1 DotU family type IV/VI secretion system protein [Achromobacter sp. ACM02]MBD9420525.1 DotU family type IV/VI secretion system protein [Achromobacter sp. ACM04]MBD9430600.1 DotU family type IV/VI secretion system protein [Achromobacter sp. ACM03]MBD9472166.1 DotU family type IV/VI secretion system protein [Achromobacter sp. ACM01]RIJ03085.1 DotU family type IV/VI secretion system protein [Achromobacter s